MLVYDITNEKSFDNIKNWIRNIEEVKYFILVNCLWLRAGVHANQFTNIAICHFCVEMCVLV